METLLYIGLGIGIGIAIGWLYVKLKTNTIIQSERDTAQSKFSQLERDFVNELSAAKANLITTNQTIADRNKEIESKKTR